MTVTSMKTDYCGELRISDEGKEVSLAGWAATIRDLGGIIFAELRDKTGFFQIVADPARNNDVYKVIKDLKDESVIKVSGKITKRPEDTLNPKLPTGEVEMYP